MQILLTVSRTVRAYTNRRKKCELALGALKMREWKMQER